MNRLECKLAWAGVALAAITGCGRPSDAIKGPTTAKSETSETSPRNRMAETKGGAPVEPGAKPKPNPAKAPVIPKSPEFNPEAFAIPKTGNGEWQKSKVPPAVLADRIGLAIRGMSKTYGEAISSIKTPSESGQVKSEIKVRDDKTYSIQLLQLSAMPGLIEVRADGTKKAVSNVDGGFGKPKPLGAQGPEGGLKGRQLVEKWPTEFPKLAFLGLTDGKDVWKPYLTELLSGKSGFTGEIAERTKTFRGKNWLSYRVTAKRTPEMAKKLGACEIEMVFDGNRYLPVTIRVNRTEPTGGKWNILWQAGWNFGKAFEAKDFTLPKAS